MIKAIIKLAVAVFYLFILHDTYKALLGHSAEMAVGFKMALIYVGILLFMVKSVGFLYDVVKKWTRENKYSRAKKTTPHPLNDVS